MAKTRTILRPIPANTSKWRTMFKKRKASLFKKASELSKLCGVETCVVLAEGPGDPRPDIWPPRQDAVPILSRFIHVPQAEKAKRMLDKDSKFLQQMQKLQLQLQKIERKNRELETAVLLDEVLSGRFSIAGVELTMEKIVDLSEMVEKRVGEVNQRISVLISESTPHDHLTPDQGRTPSTALPPGWCKEAMTDFGFFGALAPPLLTSDNWAMTGVPPNSLCGYSGSAAAVVPMPDWYKEGENLGVFKSTSADVVVEPLPNLCTTGDEKDQRCWPTGDNASPTVVGAEVDDDMERFLDGLIEGCARDEGAESFWDGSMEKCDRQMDCCFSDLIHNSKFESDKIIERLISDSF